MSGRIGRYTYKNTSVLKEFLGKLVQALGKKAGQAGQRRLMKKMAKEVCVKI